MQRETKKRGWGGLRPGSGRKPKDPKVKQASRVMVNLTQHERTELEKAAGDEPLGSFLRRLVLRYLARRRK